MKEKNINHEIYNRKLIYGQFSLEYNEFGTMVLVDNMDTSLSM